MPGEREAIEQAMRLPTGKTCGDCDHWAGRCSWLLAGCKTERDTHCDWAPSRFRLKVASDAT